MDLPHDHPTVATFLDFSAVMNRWCRAMIQHFGRMGQDESIGEREHHQFMVQQQQAVEAIFREFCAAGPDAVGRRMQAWSRPPEYDNEAATILSVNQGRKLVRITTIDPSVTDVRTNKPVGLKALHRYTLIEQVGRWLIRSRESSRDEGQTWQKISL